MSNTTLIESQARSASHVLTDDQFENLDAAHDWWDDEPCYMPLRVTGAAGTGKTYLISRIPEQLQTSAAFLAPTGRATRVLRKFIGSGRWCSTIHSAVYKKPIRDKQLYEKMKKELETTKDRREASRIRREMQKLCLPGWVKRETFPEDLGARLIIVDEMSMVGTKDGEHLLNLARACGRPVLAIGDPFQLPPVGDAPCFTEERCINAPTMLEVVRQAEGSEILKLATRVRGRDGKPRPGIDTDELRIGPKNPLDREYDIILCGRNKTRHAVNREERKQRGFSGLPQIGEPLIILQNDRHSDVSNGDIIRIEACEPDSSDRRILWVLAKFDDDRESNMIPVTMERPGEDMDPFIEAVPAGFAYSITAHKAQGSEFDSVLLFDEAACFRQDAARWRYTAITRAKKHLTIV